jgi:hypothetical protein
VSSAGNSNAGPSERIAFARRSCSGSNRSASNEGTDQRGGRIQQNGRRRLAAREEQQLLSKGLRDVVPDGERHVGAAPNDPSLGVEGA